MTHATYIGIMYTLCKMLVRCQFHELKIRKTGGNAEEYSGYDIKGCPIAQYMTLKAVLLP